MPSENRGQRDALRTGTIGITVIVCVLLISIGYGQLPLWPRGKSCEAYFVNAAGIKRGDDVQIMGYVVGHVTSVELTHRLARVGFNLDRKVRLGDQSVVSIKADSVLGQRSLNIAPAGDGAVTSIPVGRTTTPYTLNNALQDLAKAAGGVDSGQLAQAMGVLTDALHEATPQLRSALEGVTALSKTISNRDERIGQLLSHTQQVSQLLADRAGQINQLIGDGRDLFAALAERRQQLGILISGIREVARQISGFVADNRTQLGPTLKQLNLVLDNLNSRQTQIGESLKRLPVYSTELGEVVGSGPGFSVNTYGVPPATVGAMVLDAVFQPGKLPQSLADFLRGFISERMIIRPRTP